MIEANIILPLGRIKRIYVDQHRIKHNVKTGEDLPVLTVRATGGPYKAHEIVVAGPSTIVYDGSTLSCGAKVWIETHAEVSLELRTERASDVPSLQEVG